MPSIYKKTDNIVSRGIGGEVLLVPIRRKSADLESIYTLNETAAFIWERLDGKSTSAQIRDAIVGEFAVSLEEAEADLSRLIDELLAIEAIAPL